LRACVKLFRIFHISSTTPAMQPNRQTRQWHAPWQSRPGSSTDHREPQRRLRDSYLRRDNQDQDHDASPPRSTTQLQQRRDATSAPTPSWRDRVKLPERQTQVGARWIPPEAEENSQRRQPPVRRWRSPEPPLRLRRSELDCNSFLTSWAQRHQDPHAMGAPRSLNVSRLGSGHASDPFVPEQWDSVVAQDARSTQPQLAPNASRDDGDDDDDDAEDSDEQSNFTLRHRYSPPARSYERWQHVSADHKLQRTEGPIRLSHDDHVGVLPNQVPSGPAHGQLSRRAEMPALRWRQSDQCSQNFQSETYQERATQSLTTNSVDVQPYPILPTRQDMDATSMVRRKPHTFEPDQTPSLVDKHDERIDDGDDIRSESNAHSTSKRRPSARGKRKATLTHDEAIVDCGYESGEALVPIKAKVSGCESRKMKPLRLRTKKQCRKRCEYPEGCGKSAIGRTLLCTAHGGGKRCQYPDSCSKGAEGSTLFCRAHGGGKRCQYPEGCSKGAEGSTMFCKAHGGGKRCQYPEGCDSSARGSTMFCIAHGGGKRCQYPEGCSTGAEGRTMFCVAHGGGKRCQYPDGCSKGAVGRTMFCRAHGGGRRCQYSEGCSKGAEGSTLFCKAHGGGNRCQYPEGCGTSAIGGTLFCAAHGGGKRCQYPEGCGKSAQGSTMFCKAHGGGKRCQYRDGCDKSAQGPTLFCKAHGGGKRCQYPEGCDKSALGRTLFCAAHGGGKRCRYPDGCDKIARGSTMLCVAHGGGRRCQYPEGCDKGARGPTLLCKAHGGGRRCGHESGCRKHVISGGLCKRHDADARV
jgi:hypothetical protein